MKIMNKLQRPSEEVAERVKEYKELSIAALLRGFRRARTNKIWILAAARGDLWLLGTTSNRIKSDKGTVCCSAVSPAVGGSPQQSSSVVNSCWMRCCWGLWEIDLVKLNLEHKSRYTNLAFRALFVPPSTYSRQWQLARKRLRPVPLFHFYLLYHI